MCGGGSAVPGVGPRLLQSITANLPPSMQPVLLPVPEYMPEHAGRIWIRLTSLIACSIFPEFCRLTQEMGACLPRMTSAG